MKKAKKLNLQNIKVQSFVTALDNAEQKTLHGGERTDNPVCNTEAGRQCMIFITPGAACSAIIPC